MEGSGHLAEAALGYEADANSGKHYDSTMLLFEAIKRAGTDDPTKVRDEIWTRIRAS